MFISFIQDFSIFMIVAMITLPVLIMSKKSKKFLAKYCIVSGVSCFLVSFISLFFPYFDVTIKLSNAYIFDNVMILLLFFSFQYGLFNLISYLINREDDE